MADNTFRTFRRGTGASQRDALADPLAELARLIGQRDPHGSDGQEAGRPAQHYDDPELAPQFDWSAVEDEYAERGAEADQEYAPPLQSAESYSRQSSGNGSWPREPDYEEGPPLADPYSASNADYGDPHDSWRTGTAMDALYPDEPEPAASRAAPPEYVSPLAADDQAGDQERYDEQIHPRVDDGRDEYDDEAALPRRNGAVLALAVVGLVALGSAGAFGYRAISGSSMIPSLPPIIKPGNTPVKIVPSRDSQAGAPSQANAGAPGKAEQLVTHEEQPVNIQSANPAVPRVVTTIPVISNTPEAPLSGGQPPAVAQPAAPPSASPPLAAASNNAVQPGAPAAAAPSSGSKPVHTVIIRPDQAQPAAPPPAAAPTATAHPVRTHEPSPRQARETPHTASAGPLSIVPSQERGASPAPRAHTAMTHASESPMSLASAREEPARGSGYAVQVLSQRSEAEAQSAFRSLQARYPQQLGGRHAVIRRADLGAKGVYYRALVGPFSSAEQAGSFCRSLKAAGGSCLIQRD